MSTPFRDFLLNERPKIDAALKSYASLLMAESPNDPMTILALSRLLSKAINGHIAAIVPISRATVKEDSKTDLPEQKPEYQAAIVAQIWNDVVGSGQKATQSLGRTSLASVWNDLELEPILTANSDTDDQWRDKANVFLQGFGNLLDGQSPNGRLLWAMDGGASELQKRAQDRQAAAKERREQEQRQQQTPTIEELADEEE